MTRFRGCTAAVCALSLASSICAEACPNGQFEMQLGMFRNCLPEIGGPVGGGNLVNPPLAPEPHAQPAPAPAPEPYPQPAPSVGAYCYTSNGRFGPGPAGALGALCAVQGPNGVMMYGYVGP